MNGVCVAILMQLKKEEDLDKIAGLIEKKRDMITGKHKKGDVVTANIPANKIEEIARDYSVKSILPNRVYRALLQDSGPQINAPAMWSKLQRVWHKNSHPGYWY